MRTGYSLLGLDINTHTPYIQFSVTYIDDVVLSSFNYLPKHHNNNNNNVLTRMRNERKNI